MGMKAANFEMILKIAAATDGGRRLVIAMGDLNIIAEELEAVGILAPPGLTLIRPEGTASVRTIGKGSLTDYVLVTTRLVAAVQ